MGLILEETSFLAFYGNAWFLGIYMTNKKLLRKSLNFLMIVKEQRHNLKQCVLSCFALYVNCYPISYVRIVILPWTVKVTFITRNKKTSKTEGEDGGHIAKRILSSLEGNCFPGVSECYFIRTLQTGIIRKQKECVSWIHCLQLDLYRSD